MNLRIWALIGLIATFVATAAVFSVAGAHHDSTHQDVVDFTLPRLHGDAVSLSDYRGQWVVVNYWATWCGPCRKEIPDLSELHDERTDITVLGLAYEEVDEQVFDEFLEDYPATYPILVVDVFDPPVVLGSPRVLPTTYVVDPNGVITKTFYGPITTVDITNYIAEQG